MAYTTINKSTDYFNTKLYSGDNSTGRSITSVGFAPDFLWLKDRTTAGSAHFLSDSVRGDGKWLRTNGTFAENTDTNVITSLDSDGFTVGNDVYSNKTGDNYVAWNWKANGAGSANTDGSISSTVSANTTSGFSIVSYTGNATSGATIGHGLSSAPSMIIFKSISNINSWLVYHKSIGATKYLRLETTDAEAVASSVVNDTAPTSSIITLGDSSGVNANGVTFIAYCFAEKQGYSKFGSYTGNGNADGTFVYTGFKPAFVIVKPSSFVDNWEIYDNKRNTFNTGSLNRLKANASDAESSASRADLLSNGFKFRGTTGYPNTSGETFIYMAFAEQPLVGSNNVPCTAR